MSSFFVAGTDTEVGKTVASRAIIQALQNKGIKIVGYKPIACCQDEDNHFSFSLKQGNSTPELEEQQDGQLENNGDVLTLLDSTNQRVTYREINSYTFGHTAPLFTDEGQKIQIEKLDTDLDCLNQRFQTVLVEGCFGWLSPINKHFNFAEWVSSHQMPVVLVVGIKEGCINHSLLTAQAIAHSGVPLIGWVANRINPGLGHYTEIIDTLKEKIDAPLLGEIPYIHKPETQDVGRFLTNIDRLTYMKTELL